MMHSMDDSDDKIVDRNGDDDDGAHEYGDPDIGFEILILLLMLMAMIAAMVIRVVIMAMPAQMKVVIRIEE